MRFLRTFSWSAASATVLAVTLAACNYSFSQGGGFPADIRTLHVAAFENETIQLDLDNQLFRLLNERLPRSLGVRPGAEATADAIIRGRITRYDDVAQTRPGQPGSIEVLQHQVHITVAVQIIDVRRNEILWESNAVMGRGEYRPDTQTEETAKQLAIESIVRQIVDGAQAQW
jgi:hypothetical protein